MAGRLKWWFILGAVALLAGCGGSGGAGSCSGAAHTVQMGGAIQGSPLVVTTVTTLAGTPSTANGVGGAAAFNEPVHVASDGTSLYVTDEHSFTIRKIDIATGGGR